MSTEPQDQGVAELPARNVVEALRRVMRDLPAIGKEMESPQGYNYRGIEQITRHAQGLFSKHGVVFTPRVLSHEIVPILVNNRPWSDTVLTVAYSVFGPGGPSDRIEVGPLVGIGRDNSDKGANKAMTQAFKYALLQTFCIADAKDDPDAAERAEADERPRGIGRVLAEDVATQDEADQFAERIASAPDVVQEQMKAWKSEQKIPWPWPRPEFERMKAMLADLLIAAGEEAVDAAVSAAEPATPASPAAAPEGGRTPLSGAESDPRAAAARAQLDAVAQRTAMEREIKAMRVPDVRAQLRLAEIDDTGTGPEVKDRLIEHLTSGVGE